MAAVRSYTVAVPAALAADPCVVPGKFGADLVLVRSRQGERRVARRNATQHADAQMVGRVGISDPQQGAVPQAWVCPTRRLGTTPGSSPPPAMARRRSGNSDHLSNS